MMRPAGREGAVAARNIRDATSQVIAVAMVTTAVVSLSAAQASAAGDANRTACAAASEASPGFRSALPDCRAYEIVSEANSNDTSNVTGSFGFPEGDRVYYKSFLPTSSAGVNNGVPERFLATRTASGWQDKTISPPQGEAPSNLSLGAQENAEGVSFISDFSGAFVRSPFRNPFEEPQLNKSLGMGVYRLSLNSGAVSLMSLPDAGDLTQAMIESPPAYAELAGVNDWGAFLAGGSGDGGRVFFVTTAKLVTAPGTSEDTHEASNEIYERTEGHTYLVGLLPGEVVPNCGAEVGQGVGSTPETESYYSYGAVASSGANVVFSSPGPNAFGASNPCNEGGLFLRDVVNGTTVRLPGGLFNGRAETGAGEEEQIFTSDPITGKLYEYHVGAAESTEIGVGSLLAYSTDGSRVYFLGEEEAIYVHEKGETKLIPGTEAGGYRSGGSRSSGLIRNRESTTYGNTRNMPVASGGSSDGSHLLFIDKAQLTAYKNEGHSEAYVYDAETGTVTCISCNPTGASPPELAREGNAQLIDNFSTDIGEQQFQTPSPPFITDDGLRAVFETTEALAPQDVNGTEDVYEWTREGTDGCSGASTNYSPVIEGCVYLLSSGLGAEGPVPQRGIINGTHLVGASQELRDVFVQTPEALLPGVDNASHLYDIRVDGGFPYTPSSRGCEAGACKTAGGEATVVGEPASRMTGGPGNVRPTPVEHKTARQRLAHALRVCRRKHGKRRKRCERRARKRYAKKVTGGSK